MAAPLEPKTRADSSLSPWRWSWWWVGGMIVAAAVIMVAWLFVEDRRRAVFICYRRRSSQGDVRAIGDRLKQSFGKSNVFVDIEFSSHSSEEDDALLEKSLAEWPGEPVFLATHFQPLSGADDTLVVTPPLERLLTFR